MGKLTQQQKQMIFVALMGIAGGIYVYWNYMLSPTLTRIEQNEQKYKELIAKVEAAERQSQRLAALQAEVETLKIELAALEKQLPKDKDVPNILRVLTREALQENMEFSRLSPLGSERQQYFEVIPFDVQFTGTLHALARFLASLGQQDRIFRAQNISLTPGPTAPDGSQRLNINLKIQTYAYTG